MLASPKLSTNQPKACSSQSRLSSGMGHWGCLSFFENRNIGRQDTKLYIGLKPLPLTNPFKKTHPAAIGLLTLPCGILLGWASGSLPMTLIENGFFPVPAMN
jgi:hypothetical protein